jgi:nitroreductase
MATTAMEDAAPASKFADTAPGVHELIRERFSPRSFSPQEVSAADLRTILEAGRWAASSFNEQPWRVIVARKSDGEVYRKLLGVLVAFNQGWAKTAPVLMLVTAKRTFTHNGTENRFAMHDAGALLANMALQATALGLHGHGMAGYDIEKARQTFAIPEDYDIAAAFALGYLGTPEDLPEPYQSKEREKRVRKPLSEIAFGGDWGEPLAF